MTIGIGAYGHRAGEAVFMALQQAELVGKGSIRGFAVFAAITNDGTLVYYKTQRGGTTTLVTRGETTGVFLPPEVLSAKIAGVISSGPDRAEPLEGTLPANAGVGLVTGHRLPRSACRVHGTPLNQEVLEIMEAGLSAGEAVEIVVDENLESDAGLIAVDINGVIGIKNSVKVERRPDFAKIYREDTVNDVKVAVLMNEIHPVPAVAEIAAGVAMDIMNDKHKPDFKLLVKTGSKIELGSTDEVHVNEDLLVTKLITSDQENLVGRQRCCIPYIGAKVLQNNKIIGYIITEPSTTVDNGVIIDLSGQKEVFVAVKGYTYDLQ